MTGQEKNEFCANGNIVTVECATAAGRPYYDTLDIVQCNIENGLTCDNMVNFPQCQNDYMIRYQCEDTVCSGMVTLFNGHSNF